MKGWVSEVAIGRSSRLIAQAVGRHGVRAGRMNFLAGWAGKEREGAKADILGGLEEMVGGTTAREIAEV